MKIVNISDTHCQLGNINVPEGDLLIHAGDLTFKGGYHETLAEIQELGKIAKRFWKTIHISGNHDFLGENSPAIMNDMCLGHGITYLNNSAVTIRHRLSNKDIVVYGSPYTPRYGTWAFMRERGDGMRKIWEKIPQETDILITHGPPYGILDKNPHGDSVGCNDLLHMVHVVKPKLHVFGHIHHSYGMIEQSDITFINASSCNENYKPVNKPIIFDY